MGHRRPCKLWQVPEKERYIHKQAQVKVLESSGPLGHRSQPPPSFVDASPCLRLTKVSTRVEMNADEHHGSGGPASGPQSLKPHAWWPLLHLVGLLWMALAKTGASGWLDLNPVATSILHAGLLVETDCKGPGRRVPGGGGGKHGVLPVLGQRSIKARGPESKTAEKRGRGSSLLSPAPPHPHPSHKATHHLPCLFPSPLGGRGFPDEPSRRAEIVDVNN